MTENPEDDAKDETIEAIILKYIELPKRQAFVREYIIDHNGTQAAIRAGYSEKTAKQQASRLLSNVYIAKCISKIRTARVNALDFGKDDLIAYRISVIESPTASEKEKAQAATALQKIWGMERNEINVNLHGNLSEKMARARKRRAK